MSRHLRLALCNASPLVYCSDICNKAKYHYLWHVNAVPCPPFLSAHFFFHCLADFFINSMNAMIIPAPIVHGCSASLSFPSSPSMFSCVCHCVSCMNDSFVTSEPWTHITSYISLFFILPSLKVHQLHGWTFVLQWHAVILILCQCSNFFTKVHGTGVCFAFTLTHVSLSLSLSLMKLQWLAHSRCNDPLIITCVTRRRNGAIFPPTNWLTSISCSRDTLCTLSLSTFQLSSSCL